MKKKLLLNWTVGAHSVKEHKPTRFIPAKVPGAVQLDYALADHYDDYQFGENYKQFSWMEDSFFTYQTTFSVEETNGAYFVSKGIDYRFDVLVGGTLVLEHEGMFSPIECDLSPYLISGENTLSVVIYPAPKSTIERIDRSQADASFKPAVSYGWDFHPRLIPCGIWDDTFIELRNEGYLKDVTTNYILSEDLSRADITCTVIAGNAEGYTVQIELSDPAGKTVLSVEKKIVNGTNVWSETLQNPLLWWPNEHGAQNLYTLKTELKCDGKIADTRMRKKGFRRIELILTPEAGDYKCQYPQGRSNVPIAIKINNKVIFAKGSNWVCPTIFPGMLTKEVCDSQLTLMRDAHMNIVRCWGGAIVNKDSFFELCDEYGLMVWQEFTLSCNNYKSTPDYLKILESEATAIVHRLKEFASLCIWCGGNELFCIWSGMNDQSIAIRTLDKICLEANPHTPFLATAPLTGMGHGGYLFRVHDQAGTHDILEVMNRSKNTAYSEFGCPSASSIETLKSIIPPDEWDNYPCSPSWVTHHAAKAWGGGPDAWFELGAAKHYFGENQTLEELVEHTRLMQGIGYKYSFEEARRQSPRCSMAMNWCFNEPWKTAAGNNVIEWDGTVKPAYYEIKKALRKNLLSLRAKRFDYTWHDTFEGEVWLLCEEELPLDMTVSVILKSGNSEKELMQVTLPDGTIDQNKQLFTFSVDMKTVEVGLFTVQLITSHTDLNSEYQFVRR